MEWKADFKRAVSCFRLANYSESLKLLNSALARGGDQQYVVYDSRAAVYEKLGRFRDALLDVKRAIQLAPNRWQCYSRAARLFVRIRKYEEALKMVDVSFQKVDPKDSENRKELEVLRNSVLESRKRGAYHMGMLPVELLTEIFELVVLNDFTNVIRISSVCGHWRRVALSKPSLWDTLVLTKKDPVRKSSWWIQRSRGRIRRLCLDRSLRDNLDWSMEKLKGLQWDHLQTCRLEDIDILQYLQSESMSDILSRLEEVFIKDEVCDVRRNPLLLRFGDSLRSLTLDGAIVDLQSLQMHSLVSLTLRKNTAQPLDHIFAVLSANLDLETLVLDMPFGEFLQLPESKLTLSRLNTLELCYSQPPLLPYLALPSIKTLSLRYCSNTNLVLRSLIECGASQLESLTIISCGTVDNSDLVQLLSMSSALSSLTLNRLAKTAKPVLEALSSPLLCPVLKHLDLSENVDVTGAYLVDVVKSHTKSTSLPSTDSDDSTSTVPQAKEELVSLVVNGCPNIGTDYLPWFRQRVQSFSCIFLSRRAASWKR